MTGVLGGGTWLALGLLLGLGVGVALMLGSQRRRDARVREAQEALRVSEDRLRRALDATSEIVWDWDLASDSIYHPS